MRRSKRIGIAILIAIVVAGASLLTYQLYRSSVSPARKLQGDINVDGKTDETDYKIFLLKYGHPCIDCLEDINNDSLVDGKDMLILLSELNESKTGK
jgi:hypothetical protein